MGVALVQITHSAIRKCRNPPYLCFHGHTPSPLYESTTILNVKNLTSNLPGCNSNTKLIYTANLSNRREGEMSTGNVQNSAPQLSEDIGGLWISRRNGDMEGLTAAREISEPNFARGFKTLRHIFT